MKAKNGKPANSIKDSGKRRSFDTGAIRDLGQDDSKKYRRYDLLPYFSQLRYAIHMGRGAEKYLPRNWEKGMPLSVFYNSATDHMNKAAAGFTDEDHFAAAIWNINCIMEGQERILRGMWPKEYNDLGTIFNGEDPEPQTSF